MCTSVSRFWDLTMQRAATGQTIFDCILELRLVAARGAQRSVGHPPIRTKCHDESARGTKGNRRSFDSAALLMNGLIE
jgi:hypothetical protein